MLASSGSFAGGVRLRLRRVRGCSTDSRTHACSTATEVGYQVDSDEEVEQGLDQDRAAGNSGS